MTSKNKQRLANVTQGLLWTGSIAQIYIASKSEVEISTALGFATWGSYIVVFLLFVYMAYKNSKAGIVLKKNFKDVKEFKERKEAGEKSDTLEGDEFVRSINYKSAYVSFRIVAVFMISLWIVSFLFLKVDSNGDPVYLLDSVKASTLLWVVFSFTALTGIIQLFKISPEE